MAPSRSRRGRTSMATMAAPPEVFPGASTPDIIQLSPNDIAVSPLNARDRFDAHDLELLAESMYAGRQVQPVTVVPRGAYLNLWPDHKIGDASHVLVCGARRLRAAVKGSIKGPIERLDAVVKPLFAESREAFLAAMWSENHDRAQLDPIMEAKQIRTTMTELGINAAAVSKIHGKTAGWVSQRLSLLDLTPELQERVRSGELQIRIAREVAKLPAGEQEEAVRRALEPTPAPAPAPPSVSPPAAPEGPDAAPLPPTAPTLTVVPEQADASPSAPAAAPAPPAPAAPPGPAGAGSSTVRTNLWQDPEVLARTIRNRMDRDGIERLVEILTGG